MNNNRKAKLQHYKTIQQNFSSAFNTYNSNAWLQEKSAIDLCVFVKSKFISLFNVLEVGAGTGILSKHLIEYISDKSLTISDVDHKFILYNQLLRKHPEIKSIILDLTQSDFNLGKKYKLIISNMVFQWIDEIENLILKLMQNTDILFFAIPLKGTFKSWLDEYEKQGLKAKVLDFKQESYFEQICQKHQLKLTYQVKKYEKFYNQPMKFLNELKGIGAHTPNKENEDHFSLLKLVRNIDLGINVEYKIGYFYITKNK